MVIISGYSRLLSRWRRVDRVASLGDLEVVVLRAVSRLGEALPGDVHREVARQRPVAYTTVTNTLYRLAEKGLLRTRSVSKKRVYYRVDTENRRYRSLVRGLVNRLLDAFGSAAVAQILESPVSKPTRRGGRKHG